MGVMSRRVLPACGRMCICCPGLRSRSRQPVKRYKKLLAEIFPKTADGQMSERKITKLCEYAARNPMRVPKIAKYLEQRSYKELRCGHTKFITIIMETYSKLLCMCKEQMAYFAVNLINVVGELLDSKHADTIRILGCQTLTRFIYSQVDGTYTHNIESLVPKVCAMARGSSEDHDKSCLRASSLQCLSAMVWFMAEFSHIFTDFDEIVYVTLDNYGANDFDEERGESHHNWVDEVVKCEARCEAGVGNGSKPSCMVVRPRPEKKDPLMLTSEESETPSVWAQICIQKMVELAKESTTMRRILDPLFMHFDKGSHWIPWRGLAMLILSDISYLSETSGNEQFIMAAVIRHLDHKNIGHDPQLKSDIIQIATALARQLRFQGVVVEIGVVGDLCRHLRKSLQAAVESVGQQESNLNILFQNSIEDCLLEIVKGTGDSRPLFDLMALTLEKLPPGGIVTKATIESLLVLAHITSLASIQSYSLQVFPEALLLQLLKTMMHRDVEVRIGAHRIFSVLLLPTCSHPRHESASSLSAYHEPRRWQSKTASAFASASALLEKLRREKESVKVERIVNDYHDDSKEREAVDEDWKHGWVRKSSPNFHKISSIIGRTAGSTSSADEPNIVKLSEDQTTQLLSAFWIQANLPDNLPANFEAISHSYSLTLLSSHLKNSNQNTIGRFFQLPLSLRNTSTNPNGILSPSSRRSLFMLALAMLMFAAKSYHMPQLTDFLKSLFYGDIDPFMSIGDDSQLYVKPQVELRKYGSSADQESALSSLHELQKTCEMEKTLIDIIVEGLCTTMKIDKDDLAKQLLETFTPDDTLLFGPHKILDLDHIQATSFSRRPLSFDEDFPPSSSIEEDIVSESSAAEFPQFVPKIPASPSVSHIISVGQLLESALEVAGQVAGASVSTSPLSYSTMASQCEALGMGTRRKLSSWLTHDSNADKLLLAIPLDEQPPIEKMSGGDKHAVEGAFLMEPWSALRLPPASPFDNFLKAAGC